MFQLRAKFINQLDAMFKINKFILFMYMNKKMKIGDSCVKYSVCK